MSVLINHETRAEVAKTISRLSDYCGPHQRAIVGLSGGVDSSVVACLAARALGPRNVLGVSMPSPWSSKHSVEDARELAKRSGIEFVSHPIAKPLRAFRKLLKLTSHDVTVENLQARVRGVILMSLSNKRGGIVLNTGNKSEAMVGYCTLYGDTVGAVSVIGNLYKWQVYEYARELNRQDGWIPQSVLEKPPSAELSPGQKDSDTLPAYPILDSMLMQIERGSDEDQLVAAGFADEDVERVTRMIKRNSFKLRQCPPGLVI